MGAFALECWHRGEGSYGNFGAGRGGAGRGSEVARARGEGGAITRSPVTVAGVSLGPLRRPLAMLMSCRIVQYRYMRNPRGLIFSLSLARN